MTSFSEGMLNFKSMNVDAFHKFRCNFRKIRYCMRKLGLEMLVTIFVLNGFFHMCLVFFLIGLDTNWEFVIRKERLKRKRCLALRCQYFMRQSFLRIPLVYIFDFILQRLMNDFFHVFLLLIHCFFEFRLKILKILDPAVKLT